MSVKAGLSTFRGHRTPNFDLVGRRNWWFALSGFFLVLSLFGLFVRGLNFSIDFKGGALLSFPNSSGAPISQYQDVLARYHVREATVEVVNGTQIQIRTQSLSGANLTNPGSTPSSGTSPSPTVGTSPSASVGTTPSGTATPTPTATATPTPSASVSATPTISPTPAPPLVADELRVALARVAHISPDAINEQDVGPTWGGTISSKAVQGLIIFLILVTAYISFRFEPKMAGGALAALLHDLVVTAGIYALVGRQVTPASVIAILTILGYSLYDTVVIFDKVKENTDQAALVARETYGGMVNLSLNQTLMRSVNTSLVVLLPIGSLLLFGGSTLKDFAFALFVGVASGTYSSIFVASPILVILKEREPRYQQIRARVATRAAKPGLRPVRTAAAMGDGSADGDGQGPAVVTPTSRARTGARTGQSSGQRSGRPQGSGGGRKKSSRSKPKRKRR